MSNRVASWGVELAFLRTKVGAEFQILSRLRANAEYKEASFFGSYGYFDVVAIRSIKDLSTPNFVPLDADILESAPFRFFADEADAPSEEFASHLRSWPTAIATFLKIHPRCFEKSSVGVKWEIARYLRRRFREGHVFFGLGYSELLLLTGGDNLPELCRAITDCRTVDESEEPLANVLGCRIGEALFAKTTTCPLTSYDIIHAKGTYDDLKGKLSPIITITCDPDFEDEIISSRPAGTTARTVYGKSDILILWDSEIEFAEFARCLTRLRNAWYKTGCVGKTTSYIELPRESRQATQRRVQLSVAPASQYIELLPLKNLNDVRPPALRASITDLVLRLQSCLSDSRIRRHYWDMINTLEYASQAIVEYIVPANVPDEKVMNARATVTRVADLCRQAINQRYAGLETHPETLAHTQSPLLCDISTAVSAASCTPYFIFDHLIPGKGADKSWAGFLLFGGTYSPQWHPADIVALPDTALFKPVEEWWKVTHEIAHAVYRVLEVNEKLPKDLVEYLTAVFRPTTVTCEHAVTELFANWFDWRYVFRRDTEFFLQAIWGSWRVLPIVWARRAQYLTRSFFVFLSGDYLKVLEARNAGRRETHLIPYLHEKWQEFIRTIQPVLGASDYLTAFTGHEVPIFRLVEGLLPLMKFFEEQFEKVCNIEGLESRLSPAYPDLAEHIAMLKRGVVIEDAIPNPCELHLALLRKLGHGERLSIATEVAYMFSLENTYQIMSSALGTTG